MKAARTTRRSSGSLSDGESRRADEIADEHRELASLRRRGARGLSGDKPRDRREQFAPIADRENAEFLQVVGRQFRQGGEIDRLCAERRLVPVEPEFMEPAADIHDRTQPLRTRAPPTSEADRREEAQSARLSFR